MSVRVEHGDCRDVIKTLADCSIDACVTDPPYSLQTINKRFAKVGRNDKTWSRFGPHQRTARGFMNQKWDTGETAFAPDFWVEVLRVLKPGAHLVAFGGTRTYHRLACAIEDAGFEVRDQIGWLFGSGSDEVLDAFPDAPGQQRDTGPEFSRHASVYGTFAGVSAHAARGDSGSAARFFYTAKADADDRLGSKHPTVKPVDLMAYLCRLITPPGGVVLDPFAGSGTTGMACLREGFDAILIEREDAYVADIRRRIAHVSGLDAPLFVGSAA